MADAIVILSGEKKHGGRGLMASTTAEVLLYFGEDGYRFKQAVDKLRFSLDPELSTREIIDLIGPVWSAAYSKGYDEGYDYGSL